MKIVVNYCHGGAGLSLAAAERLGIQPSPFETSGIFGPNVYWPDEWQRTDPRLVQVVEEMGPAASGAVADLKIVDIPDGSHWALDDYDGYESVTYSATPILGVTGNPCCQCCYGQ